MKLAWRDRPRHIAKPCAGCGVVLIGTSLRAFDESRAEHYAQAHDIKRSPRIDTYRNASGMWVEDGTP